MAVQAQQQRDPGRSQPSVLLENVCFQYAGRARDGYRLELPEVRVEAGEKVVVIGASGCGKTTLLQLMAGILEPGSGSVHVAGTHLGGLSERARRQFRLTEIGLVFQEFELVPHLSVEENILLPYMVGAHARRTLTSEVRARVQDLAAGAGIAPLLSRHPESLSQGERQRVAICRALITHPPLLLADEPTGNLDPETTSEVLGVLFAQVAALATTLIAVTHDHALVDRFDTVLDFAQFIGKGAS